MKKLFLLAFAFVLMSFTNLELTTSYEENDDYVMIHYSIDNTYKIQLGVYDESTRFIVFYSNEGTQNEGDHNIIIFKSKLKIGCTYYYILSSVDENGVKKEVTRKFNT